MPTKATLALVVALSACSSTPPADAPPSSTADPAPPAPTAEPTSDAAPMGTVKQSTNSVPSEYDLTAKDCQELAAGFEGVIRSEETAKLSPKLKPAQREQTEKNIETVAKQRGQDFLTKQCEPLVGKVFDEAWIKCALAAKTAKAFQTCMQGDTK